jgi:WD40 repeat protein
MAPDGSWAASGDADGSIRLWNTTDGSERAVIDGHDQSVVSFAVAPDGSWLASAEVDGSVRLWNTVDGTRRAVLKRNGDRVRHLVATPDGTRLAASTRSDRLWLWDVHSGKLVVWPHKVDFEMHDLVVAPDGSWLAGFGGKRGFNERGKVIALWRPSDGVLVSMVPAQTDDIIYTGTSTPDSSQLVVAGEDTHLRFYKIADGTWESIAVEDMGLVHKVVFAPGGAQLVTIESGSLAKVWNLADRVVYPLPHVDEEVTGVAIAPDGSWIMTVGDLGGVRLFDPEAEVWASLRLDSRLEHCVINPARPQVVVAGSNHVYFLDVSAK